MGGVAFNDKDYGKENGNGKILLIKMLTWSLEWNMLQVNMTMYYYFWKLRLRIREWLFGNLVDINIKLQ